MNNKHSFGRLTELVKDFSKLHHFHCVPAQLFFCKFREQQSFFVCKRGKREEEYECVCRQLVLQSQQQQPKQSGTESRETQESYLEEVFPFCFT